MMVARKYLLNNGNYYRRLLYQGFTAQKFSLIKIVSWLSYTQVKKFWMKFLPILSEILKATVVKVMI